MTVFRSVDRPELALEEDGVSLCDECDGMDSTCGVCRGYGLVHGYDSHGFGYPVAVESGPARARPELRTMAVGFWRGAQRRLFVPKRRREVVS